MSMLPELSTSTESKRDLAFVSQNERGELRSSGSGAGVRRFSVAVAKDVSVAFIFIFIFKKLEEEECECVADVIDAEGTTKALEVVAATTTMAMAVK